MFCFIQSAVDSLCIILNEHCYHCYYYRYYNLSLSKQLGFLPLGKNALSANLKSNLVVCVHPLLLTNVLEKSAFCEHTAHELFVQKHVIPWTQTVGCLCQHRLLFSKLQTFLFSHRSVFTFVRICHFGDESAARQSIAMRHNVLSGIWFCGFASICAKEQRLATYTSSYSSSAHCARARELHLLIFNFQSTK